MSKKPLIKIAGKHYLFGVSLKRRSISLLINESTRDSLIPVIIPSFAFSSPLLSPFRFLVFWLFESSSFPLSIPRLLGLSFYLRLGSDSFTFCTAANNCMTGIFCHIFEISQIPLSLHKLSSSLACFSITTWLQHINFQCCLDNRGKDISH